MYKLTRPDGTDFYSGTIDYAKNIGKRIRLAETDGPEVGVCGRGLHASKNPNDCFIGAKIPCRAFQVQGYDRIAGDNQKTRYKALRIIKEIKDLDSLFSWRYSEAVNPICPFGLKPPKIDRDILALLFQWSSIRTPVEGSVRTLIRDSAGHSVESAIQDLMWDSVWNSLRASLKALSKSLNWTSFWDSFGTLLWAYIGSMFSKGEYPFQPAVDLWKMGLVPSFDGKTWRLHGGEKTKILWEGTI